MDRKDSSLSLKKQKYCPCYLTACLGYKSRLLSPSSKEVKVHLGRITSVTPIILKYILTKKDTLLTPLSVSASPLKFAKMMPICRKLKGNAFLILSSLQPSLYKQCHPLLVSSNCTHETPPSKTQFSEGRRNDKPSSHCRHQIKALQTHPSTLLSTSNIQPEVCWAPHPMQQDLTQGFRVFT